MGRNQRIRKDQKEEIRKSIKQQVKQRGREKFWSVANPILRIFSAFLFTILIVLGTNVVFGKLDDHAKKPKLETIKGVEIKTAKGVIQFAFYDKDAPKTVENFRLLAERGYYNGTKFHRVEPGFVIQGGDPLSKDNDPSNDGTGGESAWGGYFNDELNPNTDSYKSGYKAGTVAMANSGKNTNGSQFFITLADQPNLPKDYTIFGHVTSGMDVVPRITKDDTMTEVKLIDIPIASKAK
ncbi:MAG: peptidylprolyl isomerase [bacterium]|nr:peptidylprolyl isomerase [bacterium]